MNIWRLRRRRRAPPRVIAFRRATFILGLTFLLIATDAIPIIGAAVDAINVVSDAFLEALKNNPELIMQDKEND